MRDSPFLSSGNTRRISARENDQILERTQAVLFTSNCNSEHVQVSHKGKLEHIPTKEKKVTHRPPPALPHECGDQRNYRDRTANTYARSRVRERKTHFNPNSNGVGSRALRPAEVKLRGNVHRSGVRSPFEFGSVFSGRSAIQRNTNTRSSIKRQDSSKSIPSQIVVPLLKPN